jgi:Fe-S-cluster containining protein
MARPDNLITDLRLIQQAAAAKEHESRDFRWFVRYTLELPDRRLNALVQQTTAQVWTHIDCRTCANCCKTRHPTFSRAEVQRIADYLGMSVADVRSRYLMYDREVKKDTTRELPCPFLKENLCSIYEVRPAVCAGYPHLHRNFRTRLGETLDNAGTCPIVYNVLERLKTQVGYHPPDLDPLLRGGRKNVDHA